MATRQLRICDVCETDYAEDNLGWMIMVVPNAPSDVGPVEYDFCSFDCLHSFVTSPDDAEETETTEDGEKSEGPVPEKIVAQLQEVADQQSQQPEPPRPAMTLAEAMMHGLKPQPHV